MPVVTPTAQEQVENQASQPAVDHNVHIFEFDLEGETITANTTATYELDLGSVEGAVSFSHSISETDLTVNYNGFVDADNQVNIDLTESGGTDTTLSAGSVVTVVVHQY